MTEHCRRGFSLMEVLLSTSILLGSSIALIELATIGRKQANSAYDLNTAQLLCQAKLDEIVVGLTPRKAVEMQEFEDNPDWLYSVTLDPLRQPGLVSVKVSVFKGPQDSKPRETFSLVRWLSDISLKPADGTKPSTNPGPSKPVSAPLPLRERNP